MTADNTNDTFAAHADAAAKAEDRFGPGIKFPAFIEALMSGGLAIPEDEGFEDAQDHFAVAQQLTQMSNNGEALADQLELNDMAGVAEFVREAAKQVRKGAKLARSTAREALIVDTSAELDD